MVELPKSRPPRVHRYNEATAYHHSEENFGWAVSYADVLMVLLSFFVLFFSMSKTETNSILQKIVEIEGGRQIPNADTAAASLSSAAPTVKPAALEKPPSRIQVPIAAGATPSGLTKASLVSKLKAIDSNIRIESLKNSEAVVLMLPNNSYAPGGLVLQPRAQKIFESTLKKIRKYRSELEITFVGYSDKQAVRKKKSKAIQSNFDLSAIRASRALQKAARMGFPMDQLKAHGKGSYGRDSRTLSIQISLKGATI
jgi:flagellar motor protein MotB